MLVFCEGLSDAPNQWRDDIVYYLTKGRHADRIAPLCVGLEALIAMLRARSTS